MFERTEPLIFNIRLCPSCIVIAQPDFFVYNASKGAVAQLTKCLAMDLAKYNVRVNDICPGTIWTQASYNHMKFLGISKERGMKVC